MSYRVAGTAGAVVTCPLEVVKTRLQSSNPVFGNPESGTTYHNNGHGPGGGGGGKGRSNSVPSYSSNQRHYHTLQTNRGHLMRHRSASSCVHSGRNSQIMAVTRAVPSSPMPTNSTPKLGLIQCLR